jgi:hypothetical protein
MTSILFEYEAGHIDATFSQDSRYDYIKLDMRMDGDITTTTECNLEGYLADPEQYQKEGVEFTVYMASVFCPFPDFIRFLEAITLDVQECAFHWDAEGPDGEMRWERRYLEDTGFLTVNWCSNKDQFSHRMMLNTRQVVRMLYSAFRSFVESSDYDPIRYENLSYGDSFALVISNASLDDLSDKLVQLDAIDVEAVIQKLKGVVHERNIKGSKMSFPVEYFLEGTEAIVPSSEQDPVILPEWGSWDLAQRRVDLKDIFGWRYISNFGANLRQLQSTLVESWLALPEPLPHRHDRIRKSTNDVMQN